MISSVVANCLNCDWFLTTSIYPALNRATYIGISELHDRRFRYWLVTYSAWIQYLPQCLLLIGYLEINCLEICIKIQQFSCKNIDLKWPRTMSAIFPDLSVLITMTSWHKHVFHVTDPWTLTWGGSTRPVDSPHKGPITPSFDAFFDVRLIKRLNKQWICLWFETPWRSHDVTLMCSKYALLSYIIQILIG